REYCRGPWSERRKGIHCGCPSLFLFGCCLLWEVVAEGGPEHIVVAVCSTAGVGGPTRARPEGAPEPAVLKALAQTALRPAVEVVPVSNGNLLDRFVLVPA